MKPENVLLKQRGSSAIKVIDFGSSCFENQKGKIFPLDLFGCRGKRQINTDESTFCESVHSNLPFGELRMALLGPPFNFSF